MSQERPTDVLFTLTCAECDAGDDLHSLEAALAIGWIQITFAPDLPMANFVGVCPECQQASLGDKSTDD